MTTVGVKSSEVHTPELTKNDVHTGTLCPLLGSLSNKDGEGYENVT